jgi:DNA-directed RNA polymerase subunit M/transcription elongation factor TFIIS
MTLPTQTIVRTACPSCKAQYDFPESMAGQHGKCAKCGAAFIVPAPAPPKAAPKPPADDAPQYIGVDCHLCGTRMYGGPDQVGKKLKCPDCGALTVLPPPPPSKQKNIPAALEGDQYELWEPDVKPSEVFAHQPKYIAVACNRCGTIMYATERQVGQTIDCPDCGRSEVVHRPAAPKKKRSPLAGDAETPVLDPNAAPGERPSALSPEQRRRIYEEERDSEYGRALEKSRRTGKPMEVDVHGRPILPRWPLFTGIITFLFSTGIPIRIVGLAAAFYCSVNIVLYGIAMAMSGGLGAVGGMCLFALGAGLTMIFASIACSCFLTVVAESSEGVKEIQSWPGLLDWFGSFFAFAVAAIMSAFPGWAIGHFVPHDGLVLTLVIAGSVLVSFPVIVLSQLDIGSVWGVLSPRVLKSMLQCPFSWLTFLVQTAAIAAAWIAASLFALGFGFNPLIVAAPLGTIGLFLYARLLGRLGWRLAEAMPEPT